MVIAWLTIRLDGHSNEALDHLETVMSGMDKLEDTLDDANTMVSTFSEDLGEARDLLKRVGVDLKDLELEAVADVLDSLKDNREDLNSILLNLRDVDVQYYINEAKQIDWDALLAGLNDIMAFIKAKQGDEVIRKPMSQSINVMPSFDDIPDDDELTDFDDDFDEAEDEGYSLMPMPSINPPSPSLSLKRDKPKSGGLSLKRNR
jgi:ABC-type transporter Mla subunit MlaD